MSAEENAPGPSSGRQAERAAADSRTDMPREESAAPSTLISTGTVIHLARGLGTGRLRATTGRELEFELRFVDTGGVTRPEPPEWLREGTVVGYDVAWTSRGLRVCRLFPLRSP